MNVLVEAHVIEVNMVPLVILLQQLDKRLRRVRGLAWCGENTVVLSFHSRERWRKRKECVERFLRY